MAGGSFMLLQICTLYFILSTFYFLMDIYITLDYEIYFGEKHGTVEKCIIYPTDELTQIADKHQIKLVQFVDVGFVLKLDEYRKKFPVLDKDYNSIIEQLQRIGKNGHDIQLHIHPHWEDCFYDGKKWIINVERYKLTDFSAQEIEEIVARYKNALQQITDKNIFAYRAGGWCLQPFDKLKEAFYKNGTRVSNFYTRGMSLSGPSWGQLDTGQHLQIKGNVEYDRYTMWVYDYLNFDPAREPPPSDLPKTDHLTIR